MKRFVALILAFAASFAMAEDNPLQKNMYDMENALGKMQKGYLYNNIQMVHEGLNDLTAANKYFKDTQMKTFLPENKRHMSNVAINSSERIDKSVLAMKKYLDKKEYLKAHESCGQIINGCTTCHSIVRSW